MRIWIFYLSSYAFDVARFGFGDEKSDIFFWKSVPNEGFLAIFKGGEGLPAWDEFFDASCECSSLFILLAIIHFVILAYNREKGWCVRRQEGKKYRKSDQKICDFGNEIMRKEARKIDIRNAEIYRGAKVSRATFSRHYKNVTDIKIREEERVLGEFRRQINSSDNREVVIFKFVLMLYKNRNVFLVCMRRNDVFLLKRMIFGMNRLVMRSWRRYDDVINRWVRRWGTYLVIAVVEEWARRNFRGDLIEEETQLIKRVYDFLEKNQGELARIFTK